MNKKITVHNPYATGEYVVYPAHGVGKVSDVTKQNIAGTELELIVVNFDKDKMTLRIPMAKAETAGLRKISNAETINDAMTTLKGKAKVKKVMWSRRAQEYENKINSGNPVAIAEVIRDFKITHLLHRTLVFYCFDSSYFHYSTPCFLHLAFSMSQHHSITKRFICQV